MKRLGLICAVLIMLSVVPTPISAQPATPDANSITIHGTITAKGRYIFTWLDDDLCALSFWDYDFTPSLVVTDEAGAEIAKVDVGDLPGSVTMEGPVGDQHAEVCTVPYEIVLPSMGIGVRVTLDPYFQSELLTASILENAGGLLDISFERQAGDAGPDFRHRPGGLIVGTDKYRIQGILEIPTDDASSRVMATPFGCVTTGGYQDIAVGSQLKITDETGTIIGVASLEPLYVPDDELCAFLFTSDVPEATFYTFQLGRRGDITYSKDELDSSGWNIDLTIG